MSKDVRARVRDPALRNGLRLIIEEGKSIRAAARAAGVKHGTLALLASKLHPRGSNGTERIRRKPGTIHVVNAGNGEPIVRFHVKRAGWERGTELDIEYDEIGDRFIITRRNTLIAEAMAAGSHE